jgi:cytochrome c oxidase cbb3-type subunit 2
MRNVWIIVGASAGIYGTLAFFMGVLPGIVLSHVPATPGLRPLTAEQAAGRDIYVSEGCAYCHSQVVRPLAQDKVFGRPSVAGDYAYATPELLSDHRNGPDLANVGTRQPSDVWNAIHLYEPRALVAGSIMPAYPYLFIVRSKALANETVVPVPAPWGPPGEVVVEGPDAKALIAYIESLKQVPLGPQSP